MRALKDTILVLLLVLGTARDTDGQDRQLKKVSLIPQWAPQAQFAGYYVALEKGFFDTNGVDLTIITGGPDDPPAALLESGRADFATMWLSTGIEMRARGVEVVNIAQTVQKSALMLIAKKARGINEVEDIDNRKVGVWGPIFRLQPHAFFKQYDLTVTEIPQSYSVNLFLFDGVDVASAMWYNEYHTIINSGYNPDELTTFFYYDHGLNFPEDGIYVLQEFIDADPDVCASVVQASLEGWRYAFDHPEETIDIILNYMREAHIPANRMHQQWMLARMKDIMVFSEGNPTTWTLSRDDYNRVATELIESGLIVRIPSFEVFFRPCIPGALAGK